VQACQPADQQPYIIISLKLMKGKTQHGSLIVRINSSSAVLLLVVRNGTAADESRPKARYYSTAMRSLQHAAEANQTIPIPSTC
jgi:hypothetical protein